MGSTISLASQTYFTRTQKRGGGKYILVRFYLCCRNVGSSNQIAVSGNQHKQHLNIMCSKLFLTKEAARAWQLFLHDHVFFTDKAIKMAISWATSELVYSALQPKQGTFCGEATCLYHFQQVGARVYATVCYTRPSIFSGNGGKTHPATCPLYRTHRMSPASKVAQNTLYELNTFLSSAGRRKTSQSE